jgi:hypothetical protein
MGKIPSNPNPVDNKELAKTNTNVNSSPLSINEFAKELLSIISTSESIQIRPQHTSNIHIL